MKLSTRVAIPLVLTFSLMSVGVVGILAAKERQAKLDDTEQALDVAAAVMASRAKDELDARRALVRFLAGATAQTRLEAALADDAHLKHALWRGNVLSLMEQHTSGEFRSLYLTDAIGRELWRFENGSLVTDNTRILDHAARPEWDALRQAPAGSDFAWSAEGGEILYGAPVHDARGIFVGVVGGASSAGFLLAVVDEHLYSDGFVTSAGDMLATDTPVPVELLRTKGAFEWDGHLVETAHAFDLQPPGGAPTHWFATARADLRVVDAAVAEAALWLALGTAVILAAVTAVIVIVLRRALRPLWQLTQSVDRLAAEEAPRAAGSDELDELARKLRERGRREAESRTRLEKFATLGSLSAGVAHEVNNPLTFMRTNAELALWQIHERLAEPDVAPKEREVLTATSTTLERNIAGIDRIARIVQSLRLLAKPSPERRALDVGQVAQATLDLAMPKLRALEGIDVKLDDRLQTTGSPDALGQVVLNLLLNAADAAPAAGGRVWIDGHRQGDRIVLRVSDNGAGLAPQMRDRLFTPFATTKAHGTGLGLSISHRIMHEHEGELRYEERPGGGACFVVELPVRHAAAAEARAAAPAAVRGGA